MPRTRQLKLTDSQRREMKRARGDRGRRDLSKRVVKKADRKLERSVTRARKKVRRGQGPKADTRDVTRNTRVARKNPKAELREAMQSTARTARKAKLKKVEERKTVGGLLANIPRNARDIVTGLPATAREFSKVAQLMAPGAAGGKSGREAVKAAKGIKEGVQKEDPVYALGEAAVKKIKGDTKGAKKALKRAGDKAYERPVDAAAYAAGGYAGAGRGATAVKHKGNTAAATARPPKRAEGERKSSPDQVKRQRQAAKAEVKVRQGKTTEQEKAEVARIKRKPDVRQEQRYSPNAVTRTVQKKRENRKAKKGLDPFKASPRKAKKMRRRRFDEISRNVHAGGLAREQRAADQARKQHRKVKKEKLTAAQLLANQRVREGLEADDLEALRRTARSREGGGRNADTLERVKPEHLTDPKVREVAKEMREGLIESESRAKAERFFEGRDGRGTNPEFVAALQPLLARGEVVQRTKGDKPPEGKRESVPPPPDKPKPKRKPEVGPRTAEGPVAYYNQDRSRLRVHLAEGTTRPGKGKRYKPDQIERIVAAADAAPGYRRLTPKEMDAAAKGKGKPPKQTIEDLRRHGHGLLAARSSEGDLPEGEFPDETPAVKETPRVSELATATTRLKEVDDEIKLRETAAREAAKRLHPNARTKDDKIVGGRRKKRLLVAKGSYRDPKVLADLRNERRDLRKRVEQLRAAVALDETPRAGESPKGRRVVPGKGTGSVKRTDSHGKPIQPSHAQLDAIAEQRQREDILLAPERRAARVEAARAAGIEPDPRELAGAGVVGSVSPAGARVNTTTVKDNDAPDQGQQNQAETQSGVVKEPHAQPGSQAARKRRKRTAVRVDRDGYYWNSGPKAGERVVEADLAGEQGAFIRGLEHDTRPTTDLRQPRAGRGYSAEDAILGNLNEDRVLATRLDRERQITLIRLARSVEETFAHRTSRGQTRFAHRRAQQLAGRLEGNWAPLRVDANESVVVPAEIADRWTRQISLPSRTERTGRYVTRQFIRTVLPFSVTWQAGNVADLFTRLVAADARFAVPGLAGKSGQNLVIAVEKAIGDLDPHLADELTQALKGHFGARSTVAPLKFSDITQDARAPLIRAAGEKISAVREVGGVKQLANAGRGLTDKAFGVGTKAESAMVRRAAGTAMQQYAKALGHDLADHQALARKLAGEFKDDPSKLMEFQRRTLEITGDYVTRGPGLKLTQHTAVPFVQWIKASNKFVFHTLPARHPYKTAFMLWAAAITEPQRRELGLSGYITADEARKLGVKPPQEGYLAGALGLPGGKSLPVSPLTSFGEAAGILEGIQQAVTKDDLDDGLETLIGNRVFPFIQTPIRKGLRHGEEVGASRAVEALVPGTKQARRVMEGERPHPRSTIRKPIGTGGRSTTDRILAGVTAPVGREYPEPRKKGEIAPSANRRRALKTPVGKTFNYVHITPSGERVVRKVVRRPDR